MNHPVPSRHSNPFATCWTKPGALEFQFRRGESAERLVAQLAELNWQGAIVGAHGSGKSTLLASLTSRLKAAGRNVAAIVLREGEWRLPRDFVRRSLKMPRPLIVVDGYEQISWLGRRVLLARCRLAGAGLLVTSHAPTNLPLLYATEPSLPVAAQLVSTLTARNSSPVTAADVAASHATHGSNFRELFFSLYDRHEALTRTCRHVPRTAASSMT